VVLLFGGMSKSREKSLHHLNSIGDDVYSRASLASQCEVVGDDIGKVSIRSSLPISKVVS
jgi:hypothetical protein